MHFAVVIAAIQVFGPISTDLHPLVAAIDRAIETLKTQSHRVVTTYGNAGQEFGNEPAVGPLESTRQHEYSERGHLYSWGEITGRRIACVTPSCSFLMNEAKGGWAMTKPLQEEEDGERLWTEFSHDAYWSLFCIGHVRLHKLAASGQYNLAFRSIERHGVVIWGMRNRLVEDHWPRSFRAILRFSESKQAAFLERVKSHHCGIDWCTDSIVISNAHFRDESLVFRSNDSGYKHFSGKHSPDDNSKREMVIGPRSRTVAHANTDFTEQHYQPEFYGFDRKTILEAAKPKPINTSPLSMSSERIDLLIAIGIPLGLLGVLLLVIRKT